MDYEIHSWHRNQEIQTLYGLPQTQILNSAKWYWVKRKDYEWGTTTARYVSSEIMDIHYQKVVNIKVKFLLWVPIQSSGAVSI